MAKTKQQAYDEIFAHIEKQGGPYNNWCCGITSDVKGRLTVHGMPPEEYWSHSCECKNAEDAREVEKMLLDLGCDGGMGGGDEKSVFVYAYLKSPITNP